MKLLQDKYQIQNLIFQLLVFFKRNATVMDVRWSYGLVLQDKERAEDVSEGLRNLEI